MDTTRVREARASLAPDGNAWSVAGRQRQVDTTWSALAPGGKAWSVAGRQRQQTPPGQPLHLAEKRGVSLEDRGSRHHLVINSNLDSGKVSPRQ